jgi:DNA-directed RNA polymerase specialized sigma24 family protein
MEDRLLVEALRSRDPIAMGAVYDDYAEPLYGYCWFQLRNGDAAQVAFRDTLMGAEAHIGRLRAPTRFGPWLYALARIECRRRRPGGPIQPDLPVARHDQDDVDLRLMAWRAVTGLPSLSREVLDLHHRHGLATADIALITGLRAREVGELLTEAGVLLEAALIAEILAHDGLDACARRAEILRPRRAEINEDLREALVRHSLECGRCARHLPENIAPRKVYDLLPRVPLPPLLRAQVMNCFTDPDLAGYRLFAAARVSRFGAHGFPSQPGTGHRAAFRRFSEDASRRTARGWARALTAMAGALLAAVTATALCRYFGQEASHDSHGVVAAPPGLRAPHPSPAPPGSPGGARPVAAALPLGAPQVTGPVALLDGLPSKNFLWAPGADGLTVSPGRLTLPAGGTGAIVLTSGSAVAWRASVTGPVRVSPGGGTLERGIAQIITVQAPSNGPGSAVITFWPGGRQVEVAWGARPSPPPPPPPPPTPTPTPTPTTPSPTEPPPTQPPPPKPTPTEPAPATPPSAPPPSPAAPPPAPSEEGPSSGPAG